MEAGRRGAADRFEREQAYADNAIYTYDEPQGTRYTKGQDPMATKRSKRSVAMIHRKYKGFVQALVLPQTRQLFP